MENTAHQNTAESGLLFEIIEPTGEEDRPADAALIEKRRAEGKNSALNRERLTREVFTEERAIDVLDIATQTEAKMLNGELALAAERAWPTPPEDWDGENCYECEAPIPGQRLENGYFVCVSCQTIKEKKGAQRGLKPWQV